MEAGWYRLTNGEKVYVIGTEVEGKVMVSNYGVKTAWVKREDIVGPEPPVEKGTGTQRE